MPENPRTFAAYTVRVNPNAPGHRRHEVVSPDGRVHSGYRDQERAWREAAKLNRNLSPELLGMHGGVVMGPAVGLTGSLAAPGTDEARRQAVAVLYDGVMAERAQDLVNALVFFGVCPNQAESWERVYMTLLRGQTLDELETRLEIQHKAWRERWAKVKALRHGDLKLASPNPETDPEVVTEDELRHGAQVEPGHPPLGDLMGEF